MNMAFSIQQIQADWNSGKFSARQIAARNNCSETTAYKYRVSKASVTIKPKLAAKKPVAKVFKVQATPKKKAKSPPPVRKTSSVILAIDESGSMSGLGRHVPRIIERTIAEMKDASVSLASANIDQTYGIMRFGGYYKSFAHVVTPDLYKSDLCFRDQLDADGVVEAMKDYSPSGSTPMLRAIVEAYEKIKNNDIQMILVLTDGEENSSGLTHVQQFRTLMRNCPNNLTVAFLVPDERVKRGIQSAYGIEPGNVKVWDATSVEGLQTASAVTVRSQYARTATLSAGGTRSSNYFGIDLEDVSVEKAKENLHEITEYRILNSNAEQEIRRLVEQETKKPYIVGNAFYELVKSEQVVHETKQIAIRDPRTGKVFGGSTARQRLGLPSGRIKMKPGEHGQWQVFIQSTSVNRKIPANSCVLVFDSTRTR
jgi:Mg-chelatase subunit ChlD/phosphoribosylformylglycinamidine (FGAM) synthase PurS component